MGQVEEFFDDVRAIRKGIEFLAAQHPNSKLYEVCTIEECAKRIDLSKAYLYEHLHDEGFPVYGEGRQMRRVIPFEVLQWWKKKWAEQAGKEGRR